jgi:hypothetical protein
MLTEIIVSSMKAHLQGKFAKARGNINIYMEKGVGVAEHPDMIETVEEQLAIMADCEEKIQVLEKYFER